VESEEEKAMAAGKMYRKFGGIRTCGFWDMRVDRQINKQTNILTDTMIAILCNPIGAK